MRKIFFTFFIMFAFSAGSFGGVIWSLGYEYQFTAENQLLGGSPARVPFFTFDAGYRFDYGLITGFRYDHISMEDFEYAGDNARAVAVITSVSAGWSWMSDDERLLICAAVVPGYAVSVRYRRGITDYKTSAPSFACMAGIYYNTRDSGAFYYGIEAGYRYLAAEYDELPGEKLDLSGFFAGISLKHLI